MKTHFLALATLIGCVLPGFTQTQPTTPKAAQKAAPKEPAFERVTDDPKLPRVLLIGDSISMGYTIPVRRLLQGKASVHRIPENGGPTTNGLAKLPKWLGDGKWDVIHFNWGLHDLKLMTGGKHQVSVEAYENNLRELVRRLKGTGAKLIWASTTPVPEGKLNPPRANADVLAYNAIARKIMEENQIATDDLYRFVLPQLSKIQRPENVHFTSEGSDALAQQVATSIESALAGNK